MDWKKLLEASVIPPMPKKKDWKIASVGAGDIVNKCHQAAYQKAGFYTAAISSRTRERAEEVAKRYQIPRVYTDWRQMLENPEIEVVDIALPPHVQIEVIKKCCEQKHHIRGILCQKPAAMSAKEARLMEELCREAGITAAVNHNMRYDQSIRALKTALDQKWLGRVVLATIEMRARSEWQRFFEQYGMLEIFNMGIHHIDVMRFLFGTPDKITAVCRPNPSVDFPHKDGVSQYNMLYRDGLIVSVLDDDFAGPLPGTGCEQDIAIRWRIEGTEGMAEGTIGWPFFPQLVPSTFRMTSQHTGSGWIQPQWETTWFPDAFAGTMADLLIALENKSAPGIPLADSIQTLKCVEACYQSIKEERVIPIPGEKVKK